MIIEDIKIEEKSFPPSQRVLKQKDLYDILPFGKTKINKLLQSEDFPVVKIGKDYITTFNLIEKWIEDHLGEEIYL
ncbi:MAG: hypothetical protein ACLTWK_00795 [Eisenbergiella sp.]|mgnify:CR=1 FL=1